VTDRLSPHYPIRTARLLLRPWRTEELDPFHYLYDEPLTREQAAEKLAGWRSVITGEDKWMNLAVEVAATGTVAGDVGLCWRSEVHRRAEIGYAFLPDRRGLGYATEAAAAIVDLAFTGLGAHRVEGRLDARNAASAALLERLGMRHEGHLVENEWIKGEWTDEAVYAILESEWAEGPWSGVRSPD
jgi:RimJ/RimL family protein N-acetyltransferase